MRKNTKLVVIIFNEIKESRRDRRTGREKKEKIAANVLIVRKTFGFKSWQEFSMQFGGGNS